MKEKGMINALRIGKTIVGSMVRVVRSPEAGPLFAAAGFDFIVIDGEHFPFNIETICDIVRGAKSVELPCLVRVPSKDPATMGLLLDSGVDGLMVPHVDTKEEALSIVKHTKYHPLGLRGVSLTAPHTNYRKVDVENFMRRKNEETIIMAQIESRQSVSNIDEILSVEGVNIAMIGPADLSHSLGIPGQICNPVMKEAINKIIKSCRENDVACGIHSHDLKGAKEWIKLGMTVIIFSTDAGFIVSSGTRALQELREVL